MAFATGRAQIPPIPTKSRHPRYSAPNSRHAAQATCPCSAARQSSWWRATAACAARRAVIFDMRRTAAPSWQIPGSDAQLDTPPENMCT